MTVNIVEGKVGLKFIAVVEFSFGGWEGGSGLVDVLVQKGFGYNSVLMKAKSKDDMYLSIVFHPIYQVYSVIDID